MSQYSLFKSGILPEFLKYLVNGGIIGLLCWALQILSFYALSLAGIEQVNSLRGSIILSVFIGIVINYAAQRRFIFGTSGLFVRFVLLNLLSINLIAEVSVQLVRLSEGFGLVNPTYFIYPLVAISFAPFIFLINKYLIFVGKDQKR